MPVTILDAWTSTADLVAGAHSHAASTGDNRIGILMFTHEQMGGGGLTISTQVTWGGQNVTEVVDIVAGGVGGYHNLLWVGIMLETQIAAMSGSTVSVAFDNDDISGPPDGTGPFGNAKAQSAFYQDVVQKTPDLVDNDTGTGTASAIVIARSGTLNVAVDSKVAVCAVSGQGTTADDINIATGYTNEAEVLGATNDHSIFAFHRTATTADSTHNPSFPCSSANRLAIAGLELEFEAPSDNNVAELPSETLTLTEFVPTVEVFNPNTAQLGTATLTLTEFVPLAITSDHHAAELGTAVLTLAPFVPQAVVTETTVYDQDGFQFINDDGTEITATDIAAEDTNITRSVDLNTRLRIQTDTTVGDPPSATRTLQYKEVGDPADEWRDVPLT